MLEFATKFVLVIMIIQSVQIGICRRRQDPQARDPNLTENTLDTENKSL
jgi:hypothetical protein